MKVLQVNCVYGQGSTGKITKDLHTRLLNAGIESRVCYGRGNKTQDSYVEKICSERESHLYQVITRINGLMYGSCHHSTRQLKRVIEREKPDIVHLQCINGYFINIYDILKYLKENRQKTVLTVHAEFVYTANCGYAFSCNKWKKGCNKCDRYKEITHSYFGDHTKKSWYLMKKAFDGFKDIRIVCVSPWLAERARESPFFDKNQVTYILNGLDTGIFHYYKTDKLREKYSPSNRKIIFHATPNFTDNPKSIKGGRFVIELARKMKDYIFLIAGSHQCMEELPENIILLGRLENQEKLARFYSMADVTLIASKRETFSMVVAESLSCGTPVAGFYAGGPESIALMDYCLFAEYENMDKLKKIAIKLSEASYDKQKIAKEAEDKYDASIMMDSYIRLYEEFLNE